MNLLLRPLFLGGLLAASTVLGSEAFQGRVSLAISGGKDRPMNMDYAIRGAQIRMDIGSGKESMSTIFDSAKMEMILLMPDDQMYMVMPMKETLEEAVMESDLRRHNIEKTGRTETILGYKCEEYVSKEKNATTEIWIAEGLGTFMGMGKGGNPMMGGKGRSEAGWENAFKGKPGFPLRVVTRDSKGKETFRMEATKIQPGSLPASLFVPPAGYQRFQMPDLGSLNPFKRD
jgi:hypothetical protein